MSRIDVHPMLVGDDFVTQIYATEEVLDQYCGYAERIMAGKKAVGAEHLLIDKLAYYARNDFKLFIGRSKPIVPEFGIYRIGYTRKTMYRYYGGFDERDSFFIIGGLLKNGQDLSRSQSAYIKKLSKDFDDGKYKKNEG